MFDALALAAGVLAGAIAAISGFGIGSVLTPLLAAHVGTKLAVGAVSIPHVIGTAVRFASLRSHVDGRAFRRFGVLSAAGGLVGALINTRVKAPVAGALSGVFGGMVGNQGGIRSAALMGFDLTKEAFVATATAVALVVDGARVPVYVWTEWRALAALWPTLAAATAGVLAGTIVGVRVLRRIPERIFRTSVSVLVIVLGLYMLVHR